MPYASYTELKKTLEKVIEQIAAEPAEAKRFTISKNFTDDVAAFVGQNFSVNGVATFELREYQKKRWQPGDQNEKEYPSFKKELTTLLVKKFTIAGQWLDKFVAATIACRPIYGGQVFKAAENGNFDYFTNGGAIPAASIAEAWDLVNFPSLPQAQKKSVYDKFVATKNDVISAPQKQHLIYVIETMDREYTPEE